MCITIWINEPIEAEPTLLSHNKHKHNHVYAHDGRRQMNFFFVIARHMRGEKKIHVQILTGRLIIMIMRRQMRVDQHRAKRLHVTRHSKFP